MEFNPEQIKLIIGLGNPGKKYEHTYHNAGLLAVSYLLQKRRHKPASSPVLVAVPTFMNRSGTMVSTALKRSGFTVQNLLLIHDDSDIALGRYKFSWNRNAAGHKGVLSVFASLRTKQFWRLRIGIRTSGRRKAETFVLKKITAKDMTTLQCVFEEIAKKLSTK